jgi:protocatechuate 3,4-dioxygenase beta subunit
MSTLVPRRSVLGAAGIVSLGALLAACTRDSDSTTPGADGTAVTTDAGSTATVQPSATGTAGSARAMLEQATSCTLAPETTEGPYYFDVDSIRSDIREDRDGVTMRLALRVQDASEGCAPVANAVVDIWHCDAEGIYSGFESASRGGPGGSGPTDEETYLRGAQVTDADGVVEFATIYPGWYRGRAVHVHFKVHLDQSTVLTSQLFFDEDFTDKIYDAEPYASQGQRDTRIDTGDMVYDQADADGAPVLLTLQRDGDEVLAATNLVVA